MLPQKMQSTIQKDVYTGESLHQDDNDSLFEEEEDDEQESATWRPHHS
jgi:hypothetical protein